MSAFGCKADITVCRSPLLRSLLGVERTSPFAASWRWTLVQLDYEPCAGTFRTTGEPHGSARTYHASLHRQPCRRSAYLHALTRGGSQRARRGPEVRVGDPRARTER